MIIRQTSVIQDSLVSHYIVFAFLKLDEQKDDHATFRRVFENPILKGRVPGCSAKELELGEARHSQVRIQRSIYVRK